MLSSLPGSHLPIVGITSARCSMPLALALAACISVISILLALSSVMALFGNRSIPAARRRLLKKLQPLKPLQLPSAGSQSAQLSRRREGHNITQNTDPIKELAPYNEQDTSGRSAFGMTEMCDGCCGDVTPEAECGSSSTSCSPLPAVMAARDTANECADHCKATTASTSTSTSTSTNSNTVACTPLLEPPCSFSAAADAPLFFLPSPRHPPSQASCSAFSTTSSKGILRRDSASDDYLNKGIAGLLQLPAPQLLFAGQHPAESAGAVTPALDDTSSAVGACVPTTSSSALHSDMPLVAKPLRHGYCATPAAASAPKLALPPELLQKLAGKVNLGGLTSCKAPSTTPIGTTPAAPPCTTPALTKSAAGPAADARSITPPSRPALTALTYRAKTRAQLISIKALNEPEDFLAVSTDMTKRTLQLLQSQGYLARGTSHCMPAPAVLTAGTTALGPAAAGKAVGPAGDSIMSVCVQGCVQLMACMRQMAGDGGANGGTTQLLQHLQQQAHVVLQGEAPAPMYLYHLTDHLVAPALYLPPTSDSPTLGSALATTVNGAMVTPVGLPRHQCLALAGPGVASSASAATAANLDLQLAFMWPASLVVGQPAELEVVVELPGSCLPPSPPGPGPASPAYHRQVSVPEDSAYHADVESRPDGVSRDAAAIGGGGEGAGGRQVRVLVVNEVVAEILSDITTEVEVDPATGAGIVSVPVPAVPEACTLRVYLLDQASHTPGLPLAADVLPVLPPAAAQDINRLMLLASDSHSPLPSPLFCAPTAGAVTTARALVQSGLAAAAAWSAMVQPLMSDLSYLMSRSNHHSPVTSAPEDATEALHAYSQVAASLLEFAAQHELWDLAQLVVAAAEGAASTVADAARPLAPAGSVEDTIADPSRAHADGTAGVASERNEQASSAENLVAVSQDTLTHLPKERASSDMVTAHSIGFATSLRQAEQPSTSASSDTASDDTMESSIANISPPEHAGMSSSSTSSVSRYLSKSFLRMPLLGFASQRMEQMYTSTTSHWYCRIDLTSLVLLLAMFALVTLRKLVNKTAPMYNIIMLWVVATTVLGPYLVLLVNRRWYYRNRERLLLFAQVLNGLVYVCFATGWLMMPPEMFFHWNNSQVLQRGLVRPVRRPVRFLVHCQLLALDLLLVTPAFLCHGGSRQYVARVTGVTCATSLLVAYLLDLSSRMAFLRMVDRGDVDLAAGPSAGMKSKAD